MFTAQVVDWQGKMLGRYRLVNLLGRGGMGEVWQAEDTELARQVAIKLLPPVLRHEEDYLRSFAEEARTVASLEHPHILAVHDFGEFQVGDEIITYLVMPLVSTTLRARIKQDRAILPISTCLGYLRQAAQAIDYAHSKRILHRDIKPANILLQDDWLFLTDFGLARLLSTTTYRSRTHAGAGTPGYMAPEQIRGKAEAASDLYSLAIVAYQLLTGHLPFSGDGPYEIFLKHLQYEPPSPRQFNPLLPEVMEHALLKSLARQPEERHASCQAFVADLERGWNTDSKNNLAQPDADATLLAPWSKRAASLQPTQRSESAPTRYPPTPFASAAQDGLMTSHPSTPSTAPVISSEVGSRNEEGKQSEAGSLAETGPSRRKTAFDSSRRSFLFGGAATALLVAGGGIALSSFYHPAMSMPQKLSAGAPLLKLTGHTQEANNVRWNPHGRYLVSGGSDARVLLWDIETLLASSNGKLHTIEQPAASYEPDETLTTHKLDWSPDGRSLAIITSKTTWNNTGDAMEVIDIFAPGARPALYYDAAVKQDGILTALAWSPQGNTIATVVYNNIEVALWKVGQTKLATATMKDTTRTAAQKQKDIGLNLASLCWSQDGSWLVGLDTQFHLALWNIATNKMQRIALPDRTKYLHFSAAAQALPAIYSYSVVASPTSPTLLAASDNDVVVLYDMQKSTFTRLLSTDDPTALQQIPSGQRPYYAQITALSWSPDGRYLAGSYLSNNPIYIWDLQNPRPRLKNGTQMPDFTFGKTNGHSNTITDLTWSPDERYLASSSQDNTIIVWKMDGA
jgi:serine/threonine protein kinase